MRKWSLGHLTVVGTRPWELVEIAARAGYDAVDPFVGLVQFPAFKIFPMLKGDPDTVRMGEALKANGLSIHVADAFVLDARTDLEATERMVDLIAELGGRHVNALIFGDDVPHGTALLAEFAQMAKQVGLGVVLEYAALTAVASAEQALEVIGQTGSDNVRLMLDPLHHSFVGGTPESAKELVGFIGAAQMCDAEVGLDYDAYIRTGMNRLPPGEGALRCSDYLSALPGDLTISIEVPRPDEPDLVARARRMLDAARALDKPRE